MQTDGVLVVSKPHLKKRFFQCLFAGFVPWFWLDSGGWEWGSTFVPRLDCLFFSENMEFGSMVQL